MREFKILSIVAIVSFFAISLNGQDRFITQHIDSTSLISTKGKIVEVIVPQKFHLNSKGKTFLTGKDRITLAIDLPENTKEWYYYVCAVGEGSARNIQLVSQMSVLMVMRYASVSQIKVENGSSYCNVYVLPDELSRSKFENKLKPYNYIVPVSRSNFSSGVVKCPVLSNKIWLGIENTRKIHSVDVTIEVVAIVQN